MHRFFLTDEPLLPGQSVDLAPIAHQLTRVLRVQVGEQIMLLDNQGYEYPTQVEEIARHRVRGRVLDRRLANGEPNVRLTLYQCALKADKLEWVLQKGTELGITRFVPVISERTIIRPAAALTKKYDRWQTILREAAEQSGRGKLPELRAPLAWDAALGQAMGLRILPWEQHTDSATLPRALHPLASSKETAPADGRIAMREVSLLIGPEGGLSEAEVLQARALGWQIVTLGRRILRAETAAIAAAAVVMALLDEWA